MSSSPRRRVGIAKTRVALVAAVVLVLGACSSAEESEVVVEAGVPAELPTWINAVSPQPGASAAQPQVDVNYEVNTNQDVRLHIDGIDVTNQADQNPDIGDPPEQEVNPSETESLDEAPAPRRGDDRAEDALLVYDPTGLTTPLAPLEPGEHRATAELVELEEVGGQPQTIDEFSWTFTVL